ncbi:DUF4367 domain-containing protein [Paenibacillus arenosi]|uniref:DUF4367 domain-containing protein n=1 Tax=Paenibacillus arenosi TaxID=2774142 RepID=A0ABR9AZN8_9BACL|nr:DUF4367 domain-containing protein [Paenibacillus arenosi]MBD8499533.1 hypothetical protein [Paenibacillus arenosi]
MKNTTKLAIATLSSMLLLGSIHGVVHAEPISSLNGNSLIMTIAKAPTTAEKKKIISAEIKKIMNETENTPGAVYLLCIGDKSMNGGSECQYYVNFPTFKTYENYERWLTKLKGPVVVEPQGMPEGYSFVKGEIQNSLSNKAFEAKVKAEGKGKVVYSKKMEWTEAGQIKLEYANGKDNIIFQVQMEYFPMKDLKYLYQSVDSHSEEDRKKYAKILRNKLHWREKGTSYEISTNPGNPLTKDELIELAKTMIRK